MRLHQFSYVPVRGLKPAFVRKLMANFIYYNLPLTVSYVRTSTNSRILRNPNVHQRLHQRPLLGCFEPPEFNQYHHSKFLIDPN
jgi:hypothetical protein